MKKWLLFFLILSLVACEPAVEEPRLLAGWQPTAVPTRPLRPTATPLPTATQPVIPTRGATPTAVADVTVPPRPPTAVPEGVYIRESDGFILRYPSNWEVSYDPVEDSIDLYDPYYFISISAYSEFVSEDENFESYKEFFTTEWAEITGFTETTLEWEETIPFGNTGEAQAGLVSALDENGQPIGIYFALADNGVRSFILIAFGSPTDLERRHITLTEIVHQAELGGMQMFGLERDNTLVLLGVEPLPRSLDPARQTGSAAGYVGLLYSGLVRLSPNLQVEPDLAQSWEVSEDGTVYTFTLRPNLTFADGSKLTAEDVQYSWERAADPETGSTTAATYLGDIEGVLEKLAGEADSISGINIVDDTTLEVTLTGPKPYFLLKLTYPTSFIVDSHVVADPRQDVWVYEPNASGPYVLAEHVEGQRWVFARNDRYHQPPAIERVMYLVDWAGNPLSLYEAGEIDIVGLNSTNALEVRKPSHPLHDQWVSETSLCTTFIQLNNSLPPFDDPLVRQAFALAIDKEGLNDLLTEGLDVIADTILPPGMPGYSQELAAAQADSRHNVAAAQAALANSSYADNLPPIVLSASGFGDSERDDLNALIETWRDVLGADVTIDFLNPDSFTATVREEHGHMVSYGWCADYPDPENFLGVLYQSGSDFNVAGYVNEEVDALLAEAGVELDVERRLALYREIETLLLADFAAIPLLHGVSDSIISPRVQGYVLAPVGVPIVPRLSLDPLPEGE